MFCPSNAEVKLSLVWLFVFLWLAVHSQFDFGSAVHYSVNEGLPSAKVYDMLEDSRGYMWFATENGVSRFNGYRFENFTTENGLPGNSTLRLYEDNQGRIWFLSYLGSLSYFENGRVFQDSANVYFNKINIPFFANVYIDSSDTKWLSPFNGGLLKQTGQNIPEWIKQRDINNDSLYLYLELKEDGFILCYFNVFGEDTLAGRDYYQHENTWVFPFRLNKTGYHNGFLETDSGFMVYYDKHVYSVRKDGIPSTKYRTREIINISSDQDKNIWVSEKFNGVFQYHGNLSRDPVNHYFMGQSVSGTLQDREGNHWFSTTENGVFFVPSLDIRVYNQTNTEIINNTILSLEMEEGHLFLSTDGKDIYQGAYSGNQLGYLKRLKMSDSSVDNIYALLFDPPNTLYATVKIDNSNDFKITRFVEDDLEIFSLRYGYHLQKTRNNDLVMAFPNGIRIIRDNRMIYRSPEGLDSRVFVTEETPDGDLWVGTLNGLYLIRENEFIPLFPDDKVLGARISELIYRNGQLWVGSFDHGLAVLSGDSVHHLDREDGLLSRRIKCFFAENDTTLWIGTNRGLNRMHVGFNPFRITGIDGLNSWDGLPSNEINEIHKSGEYLWLATDKGLAAFDPRRIRFTQPPPQVYLQHMSLEDETLLLLDEPVSLEHNQNTITFDFHGVAFRNPKGIQYQYRLKGLTDQWNATNNTSVRFHNLDPGKYVLEIYAETRTGQRSMATVFPFRIRKHFTQTNLFLVMMFVVALTVVLAIVIHLYRIRQARFKLQRKIFMSEQKALLAQMNPHFIFNALNSIQDFILDSDEKNANAYLVLFSSLIRRVLEVSDKNYVGLKEELTLAELYLELEKFRFEGKFDYRIQISDEVNTEQVMIPSMVLQPYLENAIWHGLVPKNGNGMLDLNIQGNGPEGALITITDNGIGRKAAADISKNRKHHTPMGMKNVEERMRMLNKLNRTNITIEVSDLYDSRKEPAGTRVILSIPGN